MLSLLESAAGITGLHVLIQQPFVHDRINEIGLRAEPINYLHQGGYVMPGICLSVCLSICLSVFQLHVKTTERIFTKILPHMYLRARENLLTFGSHPLLDLDSQIFKDSSTLQIGHFSTIPLISLDKVIRSS